MNKIIILTVVFAALTGVGILGNMMFLQIQPLGMFASLDELPGSICSCADASGEFSPLNCEQFLGDFSDSPDMKCVAIAPDGILSYGNLPLPTQGCSVDFWKSHDTTGRQSVWPAGYSHDYYFNEMFQVNIKLPEQVDNGKAKNDDKEPKQENDKVTNKNKVKDDEKENNGKKVKDETGKGNPSIETAENETVEESLETDEEEVDGSTLTVEEEVEKILETVEEEVEKILETDEEEVEEILETDEEEKDASGNVIISEPKKGLSLLGALHLKGSQLNELVRESVAAMLNAAHPEIDYTYSVAETISKTQIALANEEYDDTITMLKQANVRGNTPICLT